jgi:hypothetical protein
MKPKSSGGLTNLNKMLGKRYSAILCLQVAGNQYFAWGRSKYSKQATYGWR